MKKALVESKLEFETTKVLKETTNGGGHAKAKANKPVKMSLDQFQKSYEVNGKTTIQTSSSSESKFFIFLFSFKIHTMQI